LTDESELPKLKEKIGRSRGAIRKDDGEVKLGLRDYLEFFVALVETVGIPLLVVIIILAVAVLLSFR
jgi:hypothetical protein